MPMAATNVMERCVREPHEKGEMGLTKEHGLNEGISDDLPISPLHGSALPLSVCVEGMDRG